MTERAAIDEEADLLAAELALGFLEGDELLAAQIRQEQDSVFARAVIQWQELGADWAGIDQEKRNWKPEALLARVENAVGAFIPPVTSSAANDRGRALDRWRAGALAASVAAAVLMGLWLEQRQENATLGAQVAALSGDQPANVNRLKVAQLNRPQDGPLLTAVYDDTAGKLTIRIEAVPEGELVPELWVIGPSGRARSLGQSSANSTLVIELSPEMRSDIVAGSAIALSLEAEADAPNKSPTAATILGAAKLSPLT